MPHLIFNVSPGVVRGGECRKISAQPQITHISQRTREAREGQMKSRSERAWSSSEPNNTPQTFDFLEVSWAGVPKSVSLSIFFRGVGSQK